jgi:hypothetical protein
MMFDGFEEWESFQRGYVDNLSSNLARETDAIIRACLNSYLGSEDWTVGELKGRCFCVIPTDKSSETCYIDNTALVVFYPAEFVVENNIARLTRKYKVLIDLEKEG